MATIIERVEKILVTKYSMAPERITPSATLESLGLDSLDLIELLFEVEDEFNVRVPQEGGSALKATTLQDIVDSIQKLLEQGTPTTAAGGPRP